MSRPTSGGQILGHELHRRIPGRDRLPPGADAPWPGRLPPVAARPSHGSRRRTAEPEQLSVAGSAERPIVSDLSVPPVIMGGVPLPESPGDARTLIGRQSELDELVSLLGVRTPDASGSGTAPARAVLLAGDAGVGKTRLLTELRDVAFTEGWQV